MATTSNHAIGAQETARETTGLAGLVAVLRRHAGGIASAAVAGVMLGLLYLLLTAPTYTSRSVLFINPAPGRVVDENAPVPTGAGAGLAMVDSQVAIIGSDVILRRLVETLSLDRDSEFTGIGPLVALRNYLSGNTAIDAKALAAQKLGKRIKIIRAQGTYIVEVEVSANSPAKAAQIADALVSLYLADQAMARSEDERRANALINSRLGELREQVAQAEARADDFKRRNRITISEGAIIAEQQLGKLTGELAAARALAAETKGRLDAVRAVTNNPGALGTMPDAVRSPTVQRLREQHAVVARREAALASQLMPRHPALVEARSQLGEIRSQINSELHRIAGALAADYESAANREQELERIVEASKAEVERTSTAQIKLRELEQDVAASRSVLATFLQRASETREQEQIAVPSARVVSPATVPLQQSWPINWLVLGLGGVAGLGFGVVRALASEQFDATVRLAPRSPVLGGYPVFPLPALDGGTARGFGHLHRLPRIAKSGSRTLTPSLEIGRALAAVAEPMRPDETAFRQGILHLLAAFEADRHESYPAAVMIVGADGEADAAAIALAIAEAGALRGERVLLVDACSTAAVLSATLAPDTSETWAGLLDKPEALAERTQRDPSTPLAFLPLARADLRLLKRAERRQLAANLAAASLDYDLVIIDGGTLAVEESASALLPLVDKIAIVARAGRTPHHRLDDAIRVLAAQADKIAGIVLTGTDSRPA